MPGLFVTATGTDAGKTYVTAGLICAGRRDGLAMDALKPVLSGFSPDTMAGSDTAVLLDALGESVTEDAVARVSPWRFAAPLSPDMAAAREGRALDFEAIVARCAAAASGDALTIIEGVGGVMVPLDEQHTVLDLMQALALPIVLVSGTALGAISHCLTALEAMGGRGLAPAVIVLNVTPGATVPLDDTLRTLARFCRGAPLEVLPRDAAGSRFRRVARGAAIGSVKRTRTPSRGRRTIA